jgi:hypothetical protein
VVWRRLVLCFLLLPAFASTIWHLVDAGKSLHNDDEGAEDDLGPNGARFDRFTSAMEIIEHVATFLALLAAAVFGNDWKRSRRLLVLTYVLSFVIGYVQFLYPLSKLFDASDFARYIYNALFSGYGFTFESFEQGPVGVFCELYFKYAILALSTFQAFRMLGPLSVSFLPAIARGSLLSAQVFPGNTILAWFARVSPFMFAPVAGFAIIMFTQMSLSLVFMAAGVSYIVGLALPMVFWGNELVAAETPAQLEAVTYRISLMRKCAYILAGLLLILFATVDQQGKGWVARLSAETGIQFVLDFLIHYEIMTIVGADWLITWVSILKNPASVTIFDKATDTTPLLPSTDDVYKI